MREGFKGTHIKRLDGNRIGGYGIVWGGKDLEGEYFTPDTDLWLDRIPPLNCVLFDHATTPLPNGMKSPNAYVIGKVDRYEFDEYGMWVESLIEEHEEWVSYVMSLVDKGILGYSTDSIAHLTERGADGFIKSWPIPAISITHHPAEPRTLVGFMKRVHELNELKTIFAHVSAEDALKALQAYPEDAAHKAGQEQASDGFDSSDYRRNPMLKLDAKALANTFAVSHWEQIKALIDAAKADEMPEETPTDSSKGALEEAMLPVAQQMASLLGIPEDEAMAVVMALAAQYLQGGTAPATEPEPMPDATSMYEEDPMMGKAAPLQFNASAFANAVASAQTGAAVHNPPQGAYMVNRQFNVNRGAQPVKSLSRTLRAIATKNHGAMKALGINPDTAGGYLVPTEQSNQIIELLRSKSLFLQGDASRLVSFYPMASDTLTIPKLTGGASVQWIGENAQITDNSPTFGQITLVAKKMATLIKVSNELLEDSDPDVDAIIREDMARAMAVEVDRVVLAGEGVGSVPRGLANIADVTKTALNAAPGYDNLVDMISRVEQADVESDDSWSWVFHPREKATLRKIKDSNNQYIWTGSDGIGQQMAGRVSELLLGYPYLTTTQIAIDTANNNETKMYFGRWRDVVVGMKKSIEIVASNEAGTSFEYDQTWIRAILRMDVNIRHAESIEILTDVRV